MKRRECLTILGAVVAAGPLVAGEAIIFDGVDKVRMPPMEWQLERPDISGHADSKTGTFSAWFSNGQYFDLSTEDGRVAALIAGRRAKR